MFPKEKIEEANKLRRKNALGPSWKKLQFLWDVVTKSRPMTIVEYGSGLSSLVIALALEENKQGWLWTVESVPLWAKETHKILAPYSRFCSIVPSDTEIIEIGDKAYQYNWFPPVPPDLVHIDGPQLKEARITSNGLSLLPPMIIIDARRECGQFYKKALGDSYKSLVRPMKSVFIRNDSDIQVRND